MTNPCWDSRTDSIPEKTHHFDEGQHYQQTKGKPIRATPKPDKASVDYDRIGGGCFMKIKSKKHRRKLTDILNAISTESHYLAYQINGYDDISTISHDSVDNRVEDLDQMISRYMQLRGVSNA